MFSPSTISAGTVGAAVSGLPTHNHWASRQRLIERLCDITNVDIVSTIVCHDVLSSSTLPSSSSSVHAIFVRPLNDNDHQLWVDKGILTVFVTSFVVAESLKTLRSIGTSAANFVALTTDVFWSLFAHNWLQTIVVFESPRSDLTTRRTRPTFRDLHLICFTPHLKGASP